MNGSVLRDHALEDRQRDALDEHLHPEVRHVERAADRVGSPFSERLIG